MDEIRFVAGPIVQRYFDKVESERQAALEARQKELAAKAAANEARKAKQRDEDEAKKTKEHGKGGDKAEKKEDEEMADAGTSAGGDEETK